MIEKKYFSFLTLRNRELVKILTLLSITVWISHFWFSKDFGFYVDDYVRIPRVMGITWTELWNIILKESYIQGRPFHDSSIYLFSFLGAKLGGLYALYWIAYIIFTFNAFLFYLLLKRLFDHQFFTVTGALAFCLFPANTTQAWLTSAFGIQISLTFLLIALHCYLSSRQKLSYLFAFCCLLSYETFFPVFFAAPLLKRQWNFRQLRELLRHGFILALMIVFLVMIRKYVIGTTGVLNVGALTVLRSSIHLMVYGPIVSIGMFLLRPFDTLLFWDFRNYSVQYIPWSFAKNVFGVFLPLCFIGLLFTLYKLESKTLDKGVPFAIFIKNKMFDLELELPEVFKRLAKLALAGLVMLLLAYPLALTIPPTAVIGTDTRVHLPAALGISILFACICSIIPYITNTYRKKQLATLGLAAFFTLLIGFGLIVQHDYKESWQYQRAFWTDVIRLCPDITDGTIILVENPGLKNPKQVVANNWNTHFILDQIYQFPNSWKSIPKLYLIPSGWQDDILSDKNLFYLKNNNRMSSLVNRTGLAGFGNFRSDDDEFESSNVILLKLQDRKLIRNTASLVIEGRVFPLKQVPTSKPKSLKKGYLYNYLIMRPDEKAVDYLLD